MTSFVQPHFATSHPGADRLEAAVAAVQTGAKNLSGSLALFAAPARQMSNNLRAGWASWIITRKATANDERMWSIALQDARVMADITCAISRSKPEVIVSTAVATAAPVMTRASYMSISADSAKIETANKASQVRIKRMLATANGH
jgi:hypothetical protein